VVFTRRIRQPNSTYIRRSVTDDWIRALPYEKSRVFENIVGNWECCFAMTSVALNDALSLRAGGELVCAQQSVVIASALLKRLSESLVFFCGALANRGRNIHEVPLVEPLRTSFFRGSRAQSAATWNGILHHIVFGDRRRFVHKLRILSDTVEQLEHEFDKTAQSIGASKASPACWTALDHLHYDFSTCLRETEVVLKSFLRALPAEQVSAFAVEIEDPSTHPRLRLRWGVSRVSL